MIFHLIQDFKVTFLLASCMQILFRKVTTFSKYITVHNCCKYVRYKQFASTISVELNLVGI
jgi:hypothetical protein